MTEQNPSPPPAVENPVDPLYSRAASPFERTEAPPQVAFPSPPDGPQLLFSTYTTYRTQIHFGLAILAYLMVLVGSVTIVQANPGAAWTQYAISWTVNTTLASGHQLDLKLTATGSGGGVQFAYDTTSTSSTLALP